jgi:hypothetical protein
MRNLGKTIYGQYRKEDTVNKAGGKAWKMPLKEQYKQLLNTGGLFNTFYMDKKEIVQGGIVIIKEFVPKEPSEAVDIAINARQDGFMRHAPILALVEISKLKDKELFRKAFRGIVRTPRDLIDFIDVAKQERGLGRALKQEINWYINLKLNQFYAMKYKGQLQTAAKLTHPKPENEALMKYVFGEDINLDDFPQLKAYEQLKRGEIDPVKAITDHRLEMQTVIGIRKLDAAGWRALAPQMSALQLLKNLVTLERHVGDITGILEKNLTVERLQRGKVIPFRVLQALNEVHGFSKTYLTSIANEYPKLYNFGNLGKVCIAPDVSYSMTGKHNNRLRSSTIAGMLTGILKVGIDKDAFVLPWDTRPHAPIYDGTVMSIASHIEDAAGGGTSMGVSPSFLRYNKIKVDTLIAITDNEHWYGSGFLGEWIEYKKLYPKARAILIRVDPDRTMPFPPEQATKYDIIQIFGWGDNVLKVLKLYSL